MPRHPFRTVVRLIGFLAIVVASVLDLGWRRLMRGPLDVRERAAWLGRWTARALRWMGIKLRVDGSPPASGLLISNHLGYLDVFVYSAIAPTVFVSNHNVRSWPIAGLLALGAGTIFIDRTRRTEVVRVARAVTDVVGTGQPVALFLEGTSTGGDRVLPFHSSLLAPATRNRWPLTPAFVRYRSPGAASEHELCYWGDAVFFPHFLNLLGLPSAEAHVTFGEPMLAEGDRRSLADRLHQQVCALGARAV
jgi:lyso-ornithine lipid O-acyltransferase